MKTWNVVTSDVNNKAAYSRWLDRLVRPVTVDLRSAIWKNTPTGAPDGGWSRGEVHDAFLDQVSLSGPKFSPHMEEREQKELERFLLPWSERPAWSVWGPQTVDSYYDVRGGDLSTLDDDIATFRRKWGVEAVPYPFRKTANRLPSNTNSGLPWLEASWRHSDMGDALLAETQRQWIADKPRPIPPSMPMWRVDPPGKTRFAWAESKYEALYGAPFVYPIQDMMRKRAVSPFEAWDGQEVVSKSITADLESGEFEYLSCDYSKFDQSQSPELIRRVMNDLIHPMIGRYKPNMFEAITENLVSGTVVTPERLREGEHGMPSGSVATNFVDSINNALCIEGYINAYNVTNVRYWVQGDDALIRGKGLDPKDFAEFASSVYGFNAHPDKQLFGYREADFLQYSYYGENAFLPTYPAARVGWRMIGHERYAYDAKKWNEWAVIVRAVQQLNNAINHPSVDELVSWAKRGDDLSLGAELPPKTIFQKAGEAAVGMTTARARWDAGAVDARSWDVLPIQSVIRETGP